MKAGVLSLATLVAAAAAAAAVPAGSASAQAKVVQLTVYTALENDQLAPVKQAFEAENPGVSIQWVRDSTGVITARFLAEKDNPRADAVMGLAASSLLVFERAGLLEPYRPAGADALKPAFVDQTEPRTWVGMDAFLGVVCFNTIEAEKGGVRVPASWEDLTQPALKGKVAMPHPASSGTGFLQVAAWLQMMGEEAGWAYMDRLHENIATYTHSGSAPCVQAAKGERIAGIALDMRGAREKTQGAPIEVILPKEGVGWDMEAVAVVKGTENLDAAKRLMDWAAGRKANELYSKSYAVVAMPGISNQPKNYPAGAEAAMIEADLEAMAANRDRILAEWSRRYEAKAAPKT